MVQVVDCAVGHLHVHVRHPELQDSVTSVEVLESASRRKGQCMSAQEVDLYWFSE